jgi:hypothetical protein
VAPRSRAAGGSAALDRLAAGVADEAGDRLVGLAVVAADPLDRARVAAGEPRLEGRGQRVEALRVPLTPLGR